MFNASDSDLSHSCMVSREQKIKILFAFATTSVLLVMVAEVAI